MLQKRRQIWKSSCKVSRTLAAEPAQLSDIFIEQINGVFEMHPVFAFCEQRKPSIKKWNNLNLVNFKILLQNKKGETNSL